MLDRRGVSPDEASHSKYCLSVFNSYTKCKRQTHKEIQLCAIKYFTTSASIITFIMIVPFLDHPVSGRCGMVEVSNTEIWYRDM